MTKDVKDFANGASALSRPAAGPGRAARPAAASTPAPAASHRAPGQQEIDLRYADALSTAD
ncbi:hypothetical protein ACWF8M_06655, partial [Streptomyces sp. NPDC055008]